MSKVILKMPNGNTVCVPATEAKRLIEQEGYRRLGVPELKAATVVKAGDGDGKAAQK